MKIQGLLVVLTVVNLLVLVSTLAPIRRAAESVAPVLRGRSLEIVDDQGRDTYVILEAKGTASSLRLRNEDGREQIVSRNRGREAGRQAAGCATAGPWSSIRWVPGGE